MKQIATCLLVALLMTGFLVSGIPVFMSYASTTEQSEPEPAVEPEPEPEKEIIDEGPEDEHIDVKPETPPPVIEEPEKIEDPCKGIAHIPEDTDCDGKIDPDFIGKPIMPPLDPSPSPKKPLPYCDLMPDDFQGSCHDRRDWDDITGLYPCNDGTQKKDYHDCIDASNPDWPKHCTKNFDKCKERSDKVIKIIKNVNVVKKINSVQNNGNLGIEQSIVAINYDEGAGINCFFGDDNDGQCETFDVTKDSGKEPLLQIINFD